VSELARAAGPLACVGLALLVLAPRRDLRLAGVGAWAVGGALLIGYLAPAGHAKALAAAAVGGIVLSGAIAAVLRRWPWALPFASLACFPARIPVTIGSTDANLLLPLYAVVGGATLVLAYELLRGDRRVRELGPLAWPLAALVGWMGLSLAWSDDVRQGAIELAAFFLPFGILAVAVSRLEWSPRALRWLYAQLAAMAVAFAAIGIYQWLTRDVFWNPKVIIGNAYAPFYRVNSVFYDPSIYGRFLVVAILTTLVLALRTSVQRIVLGAAAAIAFLWVGLLFSFSQSSFAALVAGVLVAAAFAWRWRAAAALGLVAAVLVTVGISAPQVRHTLLGKSRAGLNSATSGRASLVGNGIRIALHHPVTGVGVGAFKRAYADRLHLRGSEPKKAASHNTPVTVAAETGIPGLLLLGWLVVAGLRAAFRRVPRTFAGNVSLIVGLALAAIAVHSLFYNAFFEDPMTFGLLALIALAAVAVERETA
jgi:putative inorganic carbon (hco3(-)) transporter